MTSFKECLDLQELEKKKKPNRTRWTAHGITYCKIQQDFPMYATDLKEMS